MELAIKKNRRPRNLLAYESGNAGLTDLSTYTNYPVGYGILLLNDCVLDGHDSTYKKASTEFLTIISGYKSSYLSGYQNGSQYPAVILAPNFNEYSKAHIELYGNGNTYSSFYYGLYDSNNSITSKEITGVVETSISTTSTEIVIDIPSIQVVGEAKGIAVCGYGSKSGATSARYYITKVWFEP